MPVTTDLEIFAGNYHRLRRFTKHGTKYNTNNWLSELQYTNQDVWYQLFENYIQPIINQRANSKAIKALNIQDTFKLHTYYKNPYGTLMVNSTDPGTHPTRFRKDIFKNVDPWRHCQKTQIHYKCRVDVKNNPITLIFPEHQIFNGKWNWIQATREQLKQFMRDHSIHHRISWSKPKLLKALCNHYGVDIVKDK